MMFKCPLCQKMYDPSKSASCPICSMRLSLESLGMTHEKVAAIMAEVTREQPVAG